MTPNEEYVCPFKQYQLVVFSPPDGFRETRYPFKNGEVLLFLGEVVQMIGHCIVVNTKGQTFWGYHTENFREPTEDET